MHTKPVNDYPRDVIEKLTNVIPFFKQVRQQDPWQYELLLQYSKVVSFGPGDVVVQQGEQDSWLYFLLKGQLEVLADGRDHAVNTVTPGEVFGDLAMLMKQERSATVVADENCREILVFAVDFSLFGELEDLHCINLATKLAYYRNLTHSLRWKLEVYRNQHPSHELANNHRSIKLFSGKKDSKDELRALEQQGCELGALLILWNQEFGRLAQVEADLPSGELLDAISI
ncbi:MAG: cyclic nucleotide-binding domain-containing protein [Cellvibrionaceae bacterium]